MELANTPPPKARFVTKLATPIRNSPALKLVKTNALDRDQWLAVRRRGIGGSDAAAALGLSPYTSPLELWLEKTGRDGELPRTNPQDDTSSLYWGTLLEPIVAAHYTRRTGHKVRRVNAILQHPRHPWMLANLDREVIGSSDVQLLECKTAGMHGARAWRSGVPEYVQLQVQHQLAVTGKQVADVAVLVCGQELRIHRFARDDRLITHLIELEQDFWTYVQRDAPPPVDGSDSCSRALHALYPRDSGTAIDWRDDNQMGALFADLLAVRQILRTNQQREALLKHVIKQYMGDATRAIFETGEVTWHRTQSAQVLDQQRLRREAPALAQSYTTLRPGSRRFQIFGAEEHED